MKKLSVVIPVYHNEQSLPLLFTKLLEVRQKLQQKDMEFELIFVDDGSKDGSFQKLLEIKQQYAQTRIIKLTRNFGAVHAVKTGAQYVTGDCFVFLAADIQDPPELIAEMVEHWFNGAKYVICSRIGREDSFSSKIFAGIYYRLLRLYIIPDYPEGGFDLALMDRVMLPYLQRSGKSINLPLFMYWLGFQPKILYYKRQKRIHGHSRWTFAKKLAALLDVLLGFSIVPIRLISLTGLFVVIGSSAYAVLVVISALFGKINVPGFATLVVLIIFLMGLIIIMLGIIGEYLWRIFEEVNNRPEVVIDETC